MANEATLIYEIGPAIPFSVVNGTGIEKGALLQLVDPMTASGSQAAAMAIAGIAASEKIASDGKTKLGLYRSGIFKMTLSGACLAGDGLVADAVKNMVKKAIACSGSDVLGYALETGASGETILVDVRIGAGGIA